MLWCLCFSTSWDEHLFELVLPRPCCVGHIDLKFSLHPLCTSAPNIQVTLLKQSISNIGRSISCVSGEGSERSIDVDTRIDFPMHGKEDSGGADQMTTGSQSDEAKASSGINEVLTPEFLEQHGAEVMCGPVNLASFVDLSGHSGIVTLTSPQLLKVKSKSFLVHLKAMPSTDSKPAEKLPAQVCKATMEILCNENILDHRELFDLGKNTAVVSQSDFVRFYSGKFKHSFTTLTCL